MNKLILLLIISVGTILAGDKPKVVKPHKPTVAELQAQIQQLQTALSEDEDSLQKVIQLLVDRTLNLNERVKYLEDRRMVKARVDSNLYSKEESK